MAPPKITKKRDRLYPCVSYRVKVLVSGNEWTQTYATIELLKCLAEKVYERRGCFENVGILPDLNIFRSTLGLCGIVHRAAYFCFPSKTFVGEAKNFSSARSLRKKRRTSTVRSNYILQGRHRFAWCSFFSCVGRLFLSSRFGTLKTPKVDRRGRDMSFSIPRHPLVISCRDIYHGWAL